MEAKETNNMDLQEDIIYGLQKNNTRFPLYLNQNGITIVISKEIHSFIFVFRIDD